MAYDINDVENMIYDVTLQLSNGTIKTFKEITKIEKRHYFDDFDEFIEILNPLEYPFYVHTKGGEYRFSNESTTYTVSPHEIVFIDVIQTKNK